MSDPLMQAYLKALQTVSTKSKELTHTVLHRDKNTHNALRKIWLDIVNGASTAKTGAISKYLKGNMSTQDTTDIRKLTVETAVKDMVDELYPTFLFGTIKQKPTILPRVPSSVQKSVFKTYRKGRRIVSKYFFRHSDSESITVHNVLHLYFGMIAMSGITGGAVDGLREVCFDQTKTFALSPLVQSMHTQEEMVPESFYTFLDD
jgi:ribosomal protein L20